MATEGAKGQKKQWRDSCRSGVCPETVKVVKSVMISGHGRRCPSTMVVVEDAHQQWQHLKLETGLSFEKSHKIET